LPPAYASPHRKCRIASIIAIAMAPPKNSDAKHEQGKRDTACRSRSRLQRARDNRTAAKLLSCLKSESMLPADRGYDAD
jgi:hypothetical protein